MPKRQRTHRLKRLNALLIANEQFHVELIDVYYIL